MELEISKSDFVEGINKRIEDMEKTDHGIVITGKDTYNINETFQIFWIFKFYNVWPEYKSNPSGTTAEIELIMTYNSYPLHYVVG